MSREHKKSSNKYLIVLALLSIYVLSLILAAIRFRIDIVWLFYGLIPSSLSIYLALHGYHESQHAENHLRRIATDTSAVRNDIAAVRKYVALLVGISDGPEEFKL